MIAPRGLFIMDNPFIGELSPQYGYLAAVAAAEVYAALGARYNIGYNSNVSNGMHCAMRPEWSQPLKNSIEKVPDPDREPGRGHRPQRHPAGVAVGLARLDDARAELRRAPVQRGSTARTNGRRRWPSGSATTKVKPKSIRVGSWTTCSPSSFQAA